MSLFNTVVCTEQEFQNSDLDRNSACSAQVVLKIRGPKQRHTSHLSEGVFLSFFLGRWLENPTSSVVAQETILDRGRCLSTHNCRPAVGGNSLQCFWAGLHHQAIQLQQTRLHILWSSQERSAQSEWCPPLAWGLAWHHRPRMSQDFFFLRCTSDLESMPSSNLRELWGYFSGCSWLAQISVFTGKWTRCKNDVLITVKKPPLSPSSCVSVTHKNLPASAGKF